MSTIVITGQPCSGKSTYISNELKLIKTLSIRTQVTIIKFTISSLELNIWVSLEQSNY